MTRTIITSFLAVILAALMPIGLSSAEAAELRLTLANDPISGNSRKDDLYTAETSIELHSSARTVRFTERMFTNRAEGFRFDETRLGVSLAPVRLGRWTAEPDLGILHVGKGLLGESVQNQVHRVVGSREVHLPYIEESSLHPNGVVSLRRDLGVLAGHPLDAAIRLDAAPGFRSSLAMRLGIVRPIGAHAWLEAGTGARVDFVESRWLTDVVHDAGPTADVTLGWRGVALTFTHNRYGTRSNHVTLGWRASLER